MIPSTNATCSKIACRAKGCKGDYSSGKCKDLKDLHKKSCEFVTKKKCGKTLPFLLREGLGISLPPGGMLVQEVQSSTPEDDLILDQDYVLEVVDGVIVPGKSDNSTVNLTVKECTWLGGSVTLATNCPGSQMKCTGTNGRSICIEKSKATKE